MQRNKMYILVKVQIYLNFTGQISNFSEIKCPGCEVSKKSIASLFIKSSVSEMLITDADLGRWVESKRAEVRGNIPALVWIWASRLDEGENLWEKMSTLFLHIMCSCHDLLVLPHIFNAPG